MPLTKAEPQDYQIFVIAAGPIEEDRDIYHCAVSFRVIDAIQYPILGDAFVLHMPLEYDRDQAENLLRETLTRYIRQVEDDPTVCERGISNILAIPVKRVEKHEDIRAEYEKHMDPDYSDTQVFDAEDITLVLEFYGTEKEDYLPDIIKNIQDRRLVSKTAKHT